MSDEDDAPPPTKVQIDYTDDQTALDAELLRDAVQGAANDRNVSFVVEDYDEDDGGYLLRFEWNGKSFTAWFTAAFIAEVFGDMTAPRFLLA